MKMLKTIISIILTICSLFILSSCEKKNYNVEIQDGFIYVTMHCPTMGIVGINQVSYDGFTYEEVEQEVFDKIRNRNYSGSYTVSVTLQFLDSYGNYYDGDRRVVSTLSATEVKKYTSYYYFSGQTHISDAFPWNRKCTHCNNGIIQKERKVMKKIECKACKGMGKQYVTVQRTLGDFGDDEHHEWLPCAFCGEDGYNLEEVSEIYNETCNYCGGTGISK